MIKRGRFISRFAELGCGMICCNGLALPSFIWKVRDNLKGAFYSVTGLHVTSPSSCTLFVSYSLETLVVCLSKG
jgi:hypothetical protein